MKIAFLNSSAEVRGGADRWLHDAMAALRMARPDWELVLLTGQPGAGAVHVPGLQRRGLRRKGAQAARRRLQAVLADLDADIVHANDVVDPDLLSVVAETGRGVCTVQDHRFFCPGPGKVLPDGEECSVKPGLDCAICLPDGVYRERMLGLVSARIQALAGMRQLTGLSAYMTQELAVLGLDATLTRPWVNPGVDLPQPRHHLFVGRLAAHKGLRTALAAASQLTTPLPLVVVGDGPLADDARAAGVRVTGWVDRSQVRTLLGQAASLWVPSVWAEPFGIVGLEAMAAAVPVIATDRGGMSEWHRPGHTGLQVAVGDHMTLAAAADRLVRDPVLARRLGLEGRAQLSQFTAAHTATALIDTYGRINPGAA